MTKISEKPKLILRKTLKNVIIDRYNVLNEHNYFLDLSKYCILTNSTVKRQNVIKKSYKNKCDPLPDWLKDHNLSSEEEDDVEEKSISQLLIMEFQKDSANSYKVCPPFDWVHLIYLTVKNFPKEYVTCHDIHTFCRHWFPFYFNKSWINSILSTLNCPSNEYFNYSSSLLGKESVQWTVNIESVNTLEDSLKSIVKKYEKKIKSAMRYPDKLPTILKGYGVHYLGYKHFNS
ncbi:Winged helix-turn-helix DNA-binding domain [Cinara cedri]|uniref:Winged helix-turn-helix DNA-binding domain n=1 Tax=Cinara cedri TaxID=506608 RepID=A0A5E4MME1_9HEMI|nr:Winged helix-turn-helix DNA-binding domain [Cinara cedri]